jgi:hypothetical protein
VPEVSGQNCQAKTAAATPSAATATMSFFFCESFVDAATDAAFGATGSRESVVRS